MINTVERAVLIGGALLLLLLVDGVFSVSPSNVWTGSRKAKAATAQYHSQDPASGTYQYGYTGPHHAKSESSVNGITRGGYSYIDANGLMQTVSYTADAENGFRVHASNLPNHNALNPVEDTPEVAIAKQRHLEQVRKVETSRAWQEPDQDQLQYQPYQQHNQPQYQPHYQQQYQQQYQPQHQQSRHSANSRNPYLLSPEEARNIPAPRPNNAIVVEASKDKSAFLPPRSFSTSSKTTLHHHYVVPATPVAYAVPLPLIHSSMRHTQDSLGQYEYSYTGDTSAKTESRTLDGTTRGAYSYIDANGLLQQVHYIADRDGFRVLATNLPEA